MLKIIFQLEELEGLKKGAENTLAAYLLCIVHKHAWELYTL